MTYSLWCWRVEVRVVDRIISSESGDAFQSTLAWQQVAEHLKRHADMLMASASPDDFNAHRQQMKLEVIATVSHVP